MSAYKVGKAYVGSSRRRHYNTLRGPSSTRLIQAINGDQVTYITIAGDRKGFTTTVRERSFAAWVTETLSDEKTRKAVEASGLSLDLPAQDKKISGGLTFMDNAKIPKLFSADELTVGDVVKSTSTNAVLFVVTCSWDSTQKLLIDFAGIARPLTGGDPGPFVRVKVSINVGV